MKKLLFLICVPLLFGFVEPKYKDNSILFHFGKILNQYRIDNGRNGLKIDYTLKNFTEERCKYLSEVEYSHNGFEKIKQLPFGFTVAGENIAIVRNIPQNNKPYYSSNIKEIGDIMNKMAMGTSTDYDIAMYCFLKWKYSPSHNELLLNPETKRFYLSYDKSRTCYYFDYVALD
jgi:uncharacterized protein YkwD